jgi:hypothetical protein
MERTDFMPQHLSDSSFLLSKDVPRAELQIAAMRDRAVLDIRSRPLAAAPAVVVQFRQMPDRLWTYEVKVGPPDALRVIGYVRWSDDDVWIARTLGSEQTAASIRRFADRFKAATWLLMRPAGVLTATTSRSRTLQETAACCSGADR